MMINLYNFILTLFAILPISSNFYIFDKVINSRYRNNIVSNLLIIVNNAIGLWIVLSYIQWIMDVSVEENLLLFAFLLEGQTIFAAVAIISMSLFIKYLIYPKPTYKFIIFITILSSVIFTTSIFGVIEAIRGDAPSYMNLKTISQILLIILLIPIIYHAIMDLNLFLEEPLSEPQKEQIELFLRNAKLAIIAIPLIILTILNNPYRIPMTYLLLAFVQYFFSKAYYKDERIAFILPNKTYLGIVASTEGRMKFKKDFSQEPMKNTEILVGYMAGFTSMMSQFYDYVTQPESMDFKEQKILFNWRDFYYIAIFTKRDSLLIRSAMDKVVKEIEKKYGGKLEKVMKSTVMLELDDIFNDAFYFIY